MDNEDDLPEDEGVGDEELFEVVERDEGFEEDDGLALGMEDVDIGGENDSGEGDADADVDSVDDSLLTFDKHTASVFSVAVDPRTNSHVVSGGEDDKAYVWKLDDGQIVFNCTGHKDSVTCTAFSYDSKFVSTGDMSGIIRVWETETGKEVWSFECGDLEWLDWHHSAHVLLAGTAEGNVWMWKIPSGETKTFQGHGCRSTCGMFMKDGVRAGVGYEDGTVKVWDMKKGSPTFHLSDGTCHESSVTCMACHNDGTLIATGAEDSKSKIINGTTGKVLATLDAGFPDPREEHLPSIEAVTFSSSLPIIATASLSGVLGLWDLSTYRLRQQCKHPASIVRLKWDPTSSILYSCCLDGVVRVWDIRSGNCVREWLGHTSEILDLAVSSDGTKLVTGSGDNTAKVFNVTIPGR